MRAVDVIIKKRDGLALSREEIEFFCSSAVSGVISDYQVSAFLMAAYLKGMTDEETGHLTHAMADSGEMVDLSDIPGIKVDKHSTGGVGDTTTLVLAPLVASCGAIVAKMSGRGLGHTGGTLDKLESIPGLTTSVRLEDFKDQVRRIGLAVVGQTADLVPADRKFYAIRDVTGTVDSIPLIASSIMSKKIAAGTDVIVLDVKYGQGAFMRTAEEARELARLMVDIGGRLGRRVRAVITRMDSPLGRRIGNALEVQEAIEVLQGRHGGSPLEEVSLTLCAHMLELAGLAPSLSAGQGMAREHLESGAGLARLRAMVEAQGGDPACVDDPSRLPRAKDVVVVPAPRSGFIANVDALKVGVAASLLGAGRTRKDDPIDPAVGVVLLRSVGAPVRVGDGLAELHVNDGSRLDRVRALITEAYTFSEVQGPASHLILDTVVAGAS